MITKLSPAKMVSLMMGIWFFASAIGEFLAQKIGALMSVPEDVQQNAIASMPYYADILQKIAIGSILIGIGLFILVPVLRRWMKDVR